MKTKWVITIGREFCSGGAETARKVSEMLEIPYYDKEIIDETVKNSQLAQEVVELHDERPVGYMDLGGVSLNGYVYGKDPSMMLPTGIRVADAEFDTIKKVANRGPCVIVGRCADHVLEGMPNVFNVFIHADMDHRIARGMAEYNLSELEIKKRIRTIDKARSSYYGYYTQTTWGDFANYDLIIDTGRLGTDEAAWIISSYVQHAEPKFPR